MTPHPLRCKTCNSLWKPECPYYSWIELGNIGISCDSYIEFTSIVGCASHTASKSEREIREDERERVLDEIKAWVGSDRETCHRIGAIPAMLPHACVIDLVERMRRQHQEAGP